MVTLLGWLRALPEEAMRSRPLLLVWYAATLMLAGRSKGVYSLLADAEDAIGEDGAEHEHLLATAAAVRSMYARFEGDPQGAIEHARRALALLPEDNLDPRPFAAISLAQAYEAAGELEAASVAFAEAGALGRRAGHDYVALSAMASRAHLQLARGRLREATFCGAPSGTRPSGELNCCRPWVACASGWASFSTSGTTWTPQSAT